MKIASAFLGDVDRRWVKREDGRSPLHIIGSVALLLRTDYDRGTKDSDVVQTRELTEDIKARLITRSGTSTRRSDISRSTCSTWSTWSSAS